MTVALLAATNAQTVAVYAPATELSDPDYSGPVSVDWGDGSALDAAILGSGAQPAHVYALPGAYTLTVGGRTAAGARYVQSLALALPAPAVVDIPLTAVALEGELPTNGPTSLELVKAWRKIDDTRDDANLQLVVAAVNSQVRSWRVSDDALGLESWPEGIVAGATMLAARLFARRNSASGVEAFSSDGAVYVSRSDPDIAQLLKLGSWQRPSVG